MLLAYLIAAALAPTPSPAPTPAFETHDYRVEAGDVELAGRLFAPRGATTYPLVILVQGADYNDANASVYWRLIAHTYAKNGIASFSFNKRGIAGSTGTQTDDPTVQARDVAAVCRFASSLPGVMANHVGYFGTSQGGWIVPRALRSCPGSFVILASPAADEIGYYLWNQYRAVGMSPNEAKAAEALHATLAAYYRTGSGYRAAQNAVDRAVASSWYAKLQKVDYRQDIPDSHRLPTPEQLTIENRRDPSTYALYRDPNSWSVPRDLYASLTAPLLLVYGGKDVNLDVLKSIDVFQRALSANGNVDVTIRIFETADHSIQIGPRLLPGYREYMSAWILQHVAQP